MADRVNNAGVAVTIDTDWAPDPVIRDTMDLLDDFDIPATIFSTHDDGVALDEHHERALHPNFFDGKQDGVVLSDIADLFPDANGVRSHGLYTYTDLRTNYSDFDLTYESNYLLFGQDISPFLMYNNILQFPIHFMDDMWMRRGKPEITPWIELGNLCVVAFHPVHIFLNTVDIDYYKRHKHLYQDPKELRNHRYSGRGVRTVFQEILETIETTSTRVETLRTFETEFRK
jgi:hypothetical protein